MSASTRRPRQTQQQWGRTDRSTGPPASVTAQLALEDHLYEANLALIKKQYITATRHLEMAVAQDSSLACSTLAGLMLRSAIGVSSPPISTVTLPRTSYFEAPSDATPAGVSAASLFIRGLAIELSKPLAPAPRPSRPESEDDDEAERSAEGLVFSAERAQDLIVGLTSCYRFGLLSGAEVTSEGMTLASRGEVLARQLLLHPVITSAPIAKLVLPTLSPPHSPGTPLTPSLVFALTTPPRASTAPIPSSPPRSQKTARPVLTLLGKQRFTVQVSALYVLALQAWTSLRRDVAEGYWRYSIELSQSLGGSVGTKEGDEIVRKAAERLKGDADESWKLAKTNGRSNSTASTTLPDPAPARPTTHRTQSGDALVEMAFERRRLEQARSKSFKKASALVVECKGVRVTTSSSSINSLRRVLSMESTKPLASPAQRRARAGYPSPPETPTSSTPDSSSVSQLASCAASVNSSACSIKTVHSIEQPPPRILRHRGSTTSLNPPRLLRRLASSASISTVPPDFGRPRVGGSNWQQIGEATTSDIAIEEVAGRPSLPRRAVSSPHVQQTSTSAPWSSTFRRRLSSLRTVVNPFRREAAPPTAVNLLRRVLVRDDESAGPGMYWADDPDMEEEQEEETLIAVTPPSTAPSSPAVISAERFKPRLSHQRSFVDPTTPSRAIPVRSRSPSPSPIPVVDIIPPTPQKDIGLLLPPRPSRRSRKKSLPSYSISPSSFKPLPPLDPFLARLERESALGVETECDECGKQGLNFSACPRCEGKYCSRECRVKSGGGSGRHRCAK